MVKMWSREGKVLKVAVKMSQDGKECGQGNQKKGQDPERSSQDNQRQDKIDMQEQKRVKTTIQDYQQGQAWYSVRK